ncbi:hypothetical protein EVAR_71119_1 [Eumeta japonica]|uniref:Uncharacterized protein n=1 Tax=Eumeta variegata TaxID=151549 RepID=A0A4C1ZPQ0_EUMVA|nr:hypothetical protein EVAR_71119_1 [Eumeta japonica]
MFPASIIKLREHDEVGGDQTEQADGEARVHGDEAADAQRERPELDQLQKLFDIDNILLSNSFLVTGQESNVNAFKAP